MFRFRYKDADLGQLHFLRWLASRGKLEHAVVGPSGGEYAQAAA